MAFYRPPKLLVLNEIPEATMACLNASKPSNDDGSFRPIGWALFAVTLLGFASICSLLVGPVAVDLGTVWAALFAFNSEDTAQIVVR